MSRLSEVLEELPASKGLLLDETQIDHTRALVAAAWMTLRMGDREPVVQGLLREALDELAGQETP